MENGVILAQRFREVILDGHWIANTNCKELLYDIEWHHAIKRIASLNTIADLTQHINYYIVGICNVFEGGVLEIRDRYSFDFAPITSDAQWQEIKTTFYKSAEVFARHVEKMDLERLEMPFVDIKYGTYRRNIEAMIEHSYYHMGQITLLKKLIGEGYKV